MLRKYKQTSRSLFIDQFRAILVNRQEPPHTDGIDDVAHLLIPGTGSEVEIRELGPMTRRVPLEFPPDGVRLPTVLVLDDGVKAFQKLISLLESTEGIGDYLDRGFILDAVIPEIQELCINPPSDEAVWDVRVKSFLKSLRGLKKHCKVYLPVVNLQLAADLTVGRVVFRRQGFEQEAIVRPILEMLNTKENTPEEKEQIRGALTPLLVQYSLAMCSAEVDIDGHSSKAGELAHEVARGAINLLRCYIPVLFGAAGEHFIGLYDDAARFMVPAIIFEEDGSSHVNSEVHGYELAYEVEEKTLRFLTEKGAFDVLSGVLAKGMRCQLEEALCTAIWWIGTGNHQSTPAQQAVALATGLEALLIPPKTEEKADPLAKHAAHLLGISVEERQRLITRIKGLYGMRSEVVHAGRLDIPAEDLADLKYYALAVLVEMGKRAQGGWTKVQDLVDAVTRAELGGDPVCRDPSLIPRGPVRLMRSGRYTTHGKGHPFMFQG